MIEYTVKVNEDGTRFWYLNGKLHREDGPAVEYADGSKEWYLNDKRHCEDGPACEFANGYKVWYLNGKRHCEDGPAVEYPAVEYADGINEWWLNGEEVTEKEHRRLTCQVKELTVQEISDLLGCNVKVVK